MKKILAILFCAVILSSLCIVCTAQSTAPTEEAETENVFEAVYLWFIDNADTAFSALTLAGSLIIAFTYKRGLLPRLSTALGSIGESVKGVAERSDAVLTDAEGAYTELKEKLTAMGGTFTELSERLTELNDKLADSEKQQREGEHMRIIMRSQIDMLYEIFMSSSLPAYAKDSVGERIAEMKAQLGGEGICNE